MTTETTTTALTMVYEGSVKRVWQPPDSQQLWFDFTDDYSVFDWGKMPDTIANKGRALTVMGAWFFEHLADAKFWQTLPEHARLKKFDADFLNQVLSSPSFAEFKAAGLKSHYCGLFDGGGSKLSLASAAAEKNRVFMGVKKAEVLRPTPHVVLNRTVFAYPDRTEYGDCRLVPLEVVFRFGMPAGSSLKERLQRDPSYAGALGLKNLPKEGEFFARPVLELYTKLEPKDRLLTVQEALLLSGLTPDQLSALGDAAYGLALALFAVFAERGIELWDGKFEFILVNGKLMVADSIGPDELRLLYKGCHLSKEMIRQVYRGTPWEQSIKHSQELAARRNTLDWKNICSSELNQVPAPFTENVRSTVDKLYGTLTNHLAGEALFAGQPDLERFVEMAADLHRGKQA